jgi:hypothetical protein
LFQLDRHRDHLLQLYVTWDLAIRGIPCDMSRTDWGPSGEEMGKAHRYEFEKQVIDPADSDSEEEEQADEEIDWNKKQSLEDAEFLDNLEISALIDEF